MLTPATAQGQTAADLFNPDVVQEIRLSINSRDNQELHERGWPTSDGARASTTQTCPPPLPTGGT